MLFNCLFLKSSLVLTSLNYFFFTFTTHNGCGCEEEADEKANTVVDMCGFIIHKFVKDDIFTDESYAVTSNRQALYTDNQTTNEATK